MQRKRFLDAVCKYSAQDVNTRRVYSVISILKSRNSDRDVFLACRVLQQAIRMFNAKMKLWYFGKNECEKHAHIQCMRHDPVWW